MTDRENFLARYDVSRGTLERLDALVAELERWSHAINLVSPGTLPLVWTRHVLDSIQLLDVAPAKPRIWADFGSGGGFPGLVCAVAASDRPDFRDTEFHLVEADARKAAFLAAAARSAGTGLTVHPARAESLAPIGAQVVSARALAPLPRLLSIAVRHLAPGGKAVFPKGAGYRGEIAKALESRRFTYEKHPSRTDPEAALLVIGDIEHA